ncbi:hypothetical protein M422DRAFT_67642 [Sphaerobolus stellatus SS14]|uniref:Uncharacterized protein n=1 Tax=Sphaerobolus stellatus (strain SS14) TaxID=990650 RepID=A0A0C9VAI6_SPHS4|nr:hypothetical protein M422DRAFT_71018 [Sphaerobolus stellatus SS14]KIJ43954.1 hypothetical protein M422DRAFT_67642 [Sphaerobolus stellatus SS14]
MSSQTIPSSFNPHAVHPFTAGAASAPRHQPSASIAIPSPHTTSPHRAPPRPATSSIPSQVAQSHASQAYPQMQPQSRSGRQYPSQQAQPVFTPFRPERSSSPDLKDVLSKKKNASAWPAQPTYTGGQSSGAMKK